MKTAGFKVFMKQDSLQLQIVSKLVIFTTINARPNPYDW